MVALLKRIQEISFILVAVSVNEIQGISLRLAILYVNTKWESSSGGAQFTPCLASRASFPQAVCLHVIRAFLLQKLPGSIYIFCFLCDLEQEYLLGPRGGDTGISVCIKHREIALQALLPLLFVLSKPTGLSQPCLLLDNLQVGVSSLLHFVWSFMADFFRKRACYPLRLHIGNLSARRGINPNGNMENIHNCSHSNITLGLHFTIRQMISLYVMCFLSFLLVKKAKLVSLYPFILLETLPCNLQ